MKPINWNDNPLRTIISAMQRLTTLLDQESKLLQDVNVADTDRFYDEKLELTIFLEETQAHLKANQEIVRKAPLEIKRQLEVVAGELSRAMRENYNELVKAREVNKKILHYIAETIRRHFKTTDIYDRKGTNGSISVGNKPSALPPVSYNTVI